MSNQGNYNHIGWNKELWPVWPENRLGGNRMNLKQYSEIQHCLGVMEGLGTALRGTAADLFNNILKRLDRVINELAPTVDQPEAGQGEGASKPEEAKASWEEAKADWEKLQKEWEKTQDGADGN